MQYNSKTYCLILRKLYETCAVLYCVAGTVCPSCETAVIFTILSFYFLPNDIDRTSKSVASLSATSQAVKSIIRSTRMRDLFPVYIGSMIHVQSYCRHEQLRKTEMRSPSVLLNEGGFLMFDDTKKRELS